MGRLPIDLIRYKLYRLGSHPKTLSIYIPQEPFGKIKKGGKIKHKMLVEQFNQVMQEIVAGKNFSKFHSQIAVKFYFISDNKTSPDHTTLIKNYLDIIDELVLDDDRQVDAIESYHSTPSIIRGNKKPGLHVKIMPMGNYIDQYSILLNRSNFYSNDNISSRLLNREYSLQDNLTIFNNAIKYTEDTEEKMNFEKMRDMCKEEAAFDRLTPYDFPCNFSRTNSLIGHRIDEMHLKSRSKSSGIIIPAPYNSDSINQCIKNHLDKWDISGLVAHDDIDINLEVINWPGKDIDNIMIDIKKTLFNSDLYNKSISGIRILRYQDSYNSNERLRIKILPSHDIINTISSLEDQIEEQINELK